MLGSATGFSEVLQSERLCVGTVAVVRAALLTATALATALAHGVSSQSMEQGGE